MQKHFQDKRNIQNFHTQKPTRIVVLLSAVSDLKERMDGSKDAAGKGGRGVFKYNQKNQTLQGAAVI